MANLIATMDRALSAAEQARVDQVCNRFEAAWKIAGPDVPPPRIEEFLADTSEPERSVHLRQMLLLEVDYRRLRGEIPAPDDYGSRFPGLSSGFLAEAFPAAGAAPPQGWSTVAPPPFAPQLRSRRYVVRQFHARGGIGEIWLADDTEIGRQVALKRLRKKLEDHHERFLIEAQITGQLEHPGIVPIHDLGVDEEGRAFYVMTFIHGRTLKAVIDEYHADRPAGRTEKDPPEVQRCRLLEVFVKVCEAVAYAHNRGVIHRDLKPDNIMLGPYGETQVLDWGMAKVRSLPEQKGTSPPVQLTYASDSTKTQAGSIMGSPFYMAPEMADGRAVDADERTDVYLLGATLYHILTGHAPRAGRSLDEIIELALNTSPPPPRKLKAGVPRALDAICLRAMARTPENRYPGALELADDVQRYLAGAPVNAYPEPVWDRAWRWCKRHRRALGRSIAAAVVLAALMLGAVPVRNALEEVASLRRAAQERQEEHQREADKFRRRELVRPDLVEFRRLTDERQFYAASTTQAGDRTLPYDAQRGQEAGEKALVVADKLTAALEELSLPDEAAAFRLQLHDLLLLMVQSQSEQSPPPDAVQAMLGQLARAAALAKPSRGYYRLRARCYQLLGDTKQRDEETRRAAAPALRATALDHFFEAEQARTEATLPATRPGDATSWQPNPEGLARAVEHYQAALRIDPDHYWCHFQLGRCYLTLGKGTEAVEALSACVALQPNVPWGYSARGLALGLIGRHAEGEQDLDRALDLEPDFRPALLNRGILAWKQGKIEPALVDFGKVLAPPAGKRLIEAAYYRGMLYAERRMFREALADFDVVASAAPDFRFVYLSRAQLYFLQDDPRGVADLTTFLELAMPARPDAKDRVLFALRGRLLRDFVPNWGLTPKQTLPALRLARDQLNQAIQLGGRSAEVLHDLGSVLEMLGDPKQALDLYAQALAAAPAPDLKAKILSKRGWIFAQSLNPPEPEKAREAFTALLHLDLEPHNADAHAGLGYIVLRKSPAEAQREAVLGLLHGSGDYLALHNLACIYAELSQTDNGQAKQHQDVTFALLRRAVALWRRGGTGPDELRAIREEPSFGPLRNTEEFKKLLREQ